MTDDSQWRVVVRESGGSVFTTTTDDDDFGCCCYDDETTVPGEDGRPAVPSNRRPSSGHPDTIRPRARFPFAKGPYPAYRTCESHTFSFQLCLLSRSVFLVYFAILCSAPVTSEKVSIIQMKRRQWERILKQKQLLSLDSNRGGSGSNDAIIWRDWMDESHELSNHEAITQRWKMGDFWQRSIWRLNIGSSKRHLAAENYTSNKIRNSPFQFTFFILFVICYFTGNQQDMDGITPYGSFWFVTWFCSAVSVPRHPLRASRRQRHPLLVSSLTSPIRIAISRYRGHRLRMTPPLLGKAIFFSCHLTRELHTLERLWTFDIWLYYPL